MVAMLDCAVMDGQSKPGCRHRRTPQEEEAVEYDSRSVVPIRDPEKEIAKLDGEEQNSRCS